MTKDYKHLENITKPIIEVNLPEHIYHAHPALGSTALKDFGDDPYKYWYDYISGEAEDVRKKAYDFGSAFHCYFLEPERFEKEYYIRDKECSVIKGKKTGQKVGDKCTVLAYRDGLCGAHKSPLKDDDRTLDIESFERIKKMVRQIDIFCEENPLYAYIFDRKNSQKEISIFWVDEKTGITLKARFDLLHKGLILVDLKTHARGMNKFSQDGMNKLIFKYGYDIQAGAYLKGLSALRRSKGLDKDTFDSLLNSPIFLFAFVTKDCPLDVMPFKVSQIDVDKAQDYINDYLLPSYAWYMNKYGLKRPWRKPLDPSNMPCTDSSEVPFYLLKTEQRGNYGR